MDTTVQPGVKKEAALSSETIETISTQDMGQERMIFHGWSVLSEDTQSYVGTENYPFIDEVPSTISISQSFLMLCM